MLWRGSSGGGCCGPTCSNDDESQIRSSEVNPARKLWRGWFHSRQCGSTCDNNDDSRMLSSKVVPGDRKLWTNASHAWIWKFYWWASIIIEGFIRNNTHSFIVRLHVWYFLNSPLTLKKIWKRTGSKQDVLSSKNKALTHPPTTSDYYIWY